MSRLFAGLVFAAGVISDPCVPDHFYCLQGLFDRGVGGGWGGAKSVWLWRLAVLLGARTLLGAPGRYYDLLTVLVQARTLLRPDRYYTGSWLYYYFVHVELRCEFFGFRMRDLTAREVLSLRLVRVPCPDPRLKRWFEVDVDYVDSLISLATRHTGPLASLCWTRFWTRIVGCYLSRF